MYIVLATRSLKGVVVTCKKGSLLSRTDRKSVVSTVVQSLGPGASDNMNHLARRSLVWLVIFLSCLGFVLSGCVLLHYPGIEDDEALLAGPIYSPVARDFRIRIFHRDIPLMAMDYVGALKSWLYWPIFRLFKPSDWSLRFPVLLLGALTIWLFYLLLHRVAGTRAAVAGCLLLSTDASFLLTTEFDWGPVAIQHLMLAAACLCLIEFARTGSRKFLGAGFFALGLGLWDKTIFAWLIGGLVVATLAVFPRQVLARVTTKNLATAIAGFLLGVWPFAVFNARHDWRSIRNNVSFSADGIGNKAEVLRATLDGSGLFGYIVNDSSPQPTKATKTWLERTSTRIADLVGRPQSNLVMLVALPIFLIVGLAGPSRRTILFALVFMAVSWILMALTKNAGGSVHHAVLLWPFPQLVIAVGWADASRRWDSSGGVSMALLFLFLCVPNLLVTNQYLTQFIRYGPTVTWTDAIYPLSDFLVSDSPPGSSPDVFVMDWDLYHPLLLLDQGRIKLQVGYDAEAREQRSIEAMLTSPSALFVTHTQPNQFFPAPNRNLENEAAARGYRKEVLRTVADRHGQAIFEVYRFGRPPL